MLTLSRRSTATYQYALDGLKTFPALSTATIKFYNTYGQEVNSWPGVIDGGKVNFEVPPAVQETIPADSSFEVVVNYGGSTPRLMLWGNVVRDEARYPNEPQNSDLYQALQYGYQFLSPGRVSDPAWRILNGSPTVWDNSIRNKANGVACGILFDDGAMMWYAPMAGDSIKINYTLMGAGAGKCTMGFCSNYDGSNWIGITHEAGISNNRLHIEVGRGPVTMTTIKSISHTLTDGQNYTASYNEFTNTVSVYKGTDLTPLIEWTDDGGLVDHGLGERYFMFNWRAALLSPGPQLVKYKIIDDVGAASA